MMSETTPEPRLTNFMMKLKESAVKGASGGAMATSTADDATSTSGKGGSTSASATGGVSDGGKLKVNFVPVNQLKEIAGVGNKISKRMHMLRLSQGN
ncbi:hypothetical protein DPMN_059616 [Dreissena polymorpha]|uniref:Uncharacterized protein n=1 Tax=Dreissena polymorpha TaxID=45954 RepID=A0A9D4HGU1_DREPO|nr:hypothetical protein DPMN_059616 [Dreissena polymorpha]